MTKVMGRPDTFSSPEKIAEYLMVLESGGKLSYYIKKRLQEFGMIEFESVQSGKRGRPAQVPKLTTKGQLIMEGVNGG